MRTGILLAFISLGGASLSQAKSKAPLFADPSFDAIAIDAFDLYAVNPSQADSNNEVIGSALSETIMVLPRRGYGATIHVAGITPSEEMLSHPTMQWLQDLGDRQNVKHGKEYTLEHVQTHKWVLIITIDEVPSKPQNAIKLGKMAISIYGYERDRAMLIWHDHAEKSVTSGLLGNVMAKSIIKDQQTRLLMDEMLVKIPKHKKR